MQCPLVIPVVVNGTELEFDVPPAMQDGRVLVPVRAIFESLGAEVTWDSETQTVTAVKQDKKITLQIGSNIMQTGDKELVLDVPPKIIDGRTLVPVRTVSEGFGCAVDWQGDIKQVTITTPEGAM